jgi:hypothetical protein
MILLLATSVLLWTFYQDVSTLWNCTSCNWDINIGLGGEANWKAHTESLEHRKNISAVKNTPILTSFFQPKKATHMQTAVVAGTTQAWQPVTGADEATVARVATVTAGEWLPHNDVIDIDALALVDKSAPCALGLQLVQKLWRLAKGLPSSIPAGVSDELLSCFGGDPRQEVEEDEDPWEMVNRALDNALGYGKTPEYLVTCMCRGSLGIDGLCNWLELSICFLGVQGVLLELRVEKVMKSLQIW